MQVNRSSSMHHAEHVAAPDAPPASTRDDRRAVKQIARSIESDLNALGSVGHFSTDVAKLTGIRDRVSASQAQLAALSAKGLARSAPEHGGLHKARSAVVLGGGMVARGAAIVGASVAGVVEGGVTAVLCPVAGMASGAQSGLMSGAQMFGGYTWPVTAPIGAVVGAAVGGVGGVFSAVVAAPVKVALKGSYTRRTFTALDQYSKARAHVATKKMSTRDIANTAGARATKAISKAEEQCDQAEFLAAVPGMARDFAEVLAELVTNPPHGPTDSPLDRSLDSPPFNRRQRPQ